MLAGLGKFDVLAADGASATPEPGSGKPLSVIGPVVWAVAACVAVLIALAAIIRAALSRGIPEAA
jgi:hypothetical protein